MQDLKERFEAILLKEFNKGYPEFMRTTLPDIIFDNDTTKNRVLTALQSAYDLGAKESKWISVETPDSLPKSTVKLYLGRNIAGVHSSLVFYDSNMRKWYKAEGGHSVYVTHFLEPELLPLPSIPQPNKTEV